MALPASGVLSLTDIQTEFGGTNPVGLNEYYAGGAYVASGTSGTNGAVPSSGAVAIINFYGTSAAIFMTAVLSMVLFSLSVTVKTIDPAPETVAAVKVTTTEPDLSPAAG